MKKVCVIGAGISGLSVIHELEKLNIDYICYEKRDELGGLWNYSETQTSVYKSCLQNHPRQYMYINDCHIENSSSDYVTHQEYLDYLKQFDFYHIKYNSSVTGVRYNTKTSLWEVTVNQDVVLFSDVVVCSGHYTSPNIPKEYELFSGELLHSIEYKRANRFKDKKVLIVGAGSSAIQIASDLVETAKDIVISTRSVPYILRRYIDNQTLFDFYKSFQGELDTEIDGILHKHNEHQTSYNIPAPSQSVSRCTTLPISDSIFIHAKENKVKFKGKINDIKGKQVCFEHEDETYDVLILATGYNLEFSFLDFDVDYKDNFNYIIHKKQPSLYFMGMLQPVGPVPRLLSVQSKVIAQVIDGSLLISRDTINNSNINKRVNLEEYIKTLTALLSKKDTCEV